MDVHHGEERSQHHCGAKDDALREQAAQGEDHHKTEHDRAPGHRLDLLGAAEGLDLELLEEGILVRGLTKLRLASSVHGPSCSDSSRSSSRRKDKAC